jgi:hypothetical protein
MPWPQKQFRAIMANTKDPEKRKEYAAEQEHSSKEDDSKEDSKGLNPTRLIIAIHGL